MSIIGGHFDALVNEMVEADLIAVRHEQNRRQRAG
jgi:hypothetical protein